MIVELGSNPLQTSTTCALLNLSDLHPLTARASNADLFEFLDFCVAYYALDRSVARPRFGWARNFVLYFPVNRYDLWKRNASLIYEALLSLTGDEVEVVPIERTQIAEHHNREPVLPLDDEIDVVGLLSDGLDSFCGAWKAASDHSKRLALASIITTGQRSKRINAILDYLGTAVNPSIRHFTIKTHLSQQQKVKEKTQRSRTVLAIATGLTVACILGARVLECYENGVGLLNLPVPDLQYGSMSSQVLQPSHLPLWDRLARAFFEENIELQYPNRFMTKSEMVRELPGDARSMVPTTFSCDSPLRKKGIGVLHCGTCGSCRFRQLSIYTDGENISDVKYAGIVMNDGPNPLNALRYHASLLHPILQEHQPWSELIKLQPELRRVPLSDDGRGFREEELRDHQLHLENATVDLLRRHVREVHLWSDVASAA